MPKVAKELSALEVKKLQHNGASGNAVYSIGGVAGLCMQITPSGGRSWLLRTTVGSNRRELGLGGYPEVSLAQARDKARTLKEEIRQGIDPIEQRKAAKAALEAAQRRGLTFAAAVDQCLDAKVHGFKNAKHRAQWRSTLETYALPEIGKMLVSDISVQDILRVLQPIWMPKTETASRLRGRIEAVLVWSTVNGYREGDNPARWSGNLKELLPAKSKVAKTKNHPALQIEDVQNWRAALIEREGIAARALELLTFTCARSEEIRGAQWAEVDLDSAMWIVPATRIKAGREHRVPLSPDAIALLKKMPRFKDNSLVFPSPRGGQLSDGALLAVMKRLHEAELKNGGKGYIDRVSKRPAVPHGLRSTFKDWVAERTTFPGEMSEIALAHKQPNAVVAAYKRGDMLEKRRTMMMAWADFMNGRNDTSGNVIAFPGAK